MTDVSRRFLTFPTVAEYTCSTYHLGDFANRLSQLKWLLLWHNPSHGDTKSAASITPRHSSLLALKSIDRKLFFALRSSGVMMKADPPGD